MTMKYHTYVRQLKMAMLMAGCCLIAPALFATPVLRIMPLGDSITYGAPDDGQYRNNCTPVQTAGYRGPLWEKLKSAGYEVDYIGTQQGNPGSVQGMDVDHEGYPGWRVSHVTKGILEHIDDVFATVCDPHVVLLHLGTNDTGDGSEHFKHLMKYYGDLVDKICEAQPDARVVVSSILWRGDDDYRNALIHQYFNPEIRSFVDEQVAKGHRVSFVDMRAKLGVDLANLSEDKLHPSVAGYAKMAEAWYDEIVRLFPEPAQVPQENVPAVVRSSVSAVAGSLRISLDFNQPVDQATISDAKNYVLSSGIYGAPNVVAHSSRSVTLEWPRHDLFDVVQLDLTGVRNEDGAKMINQSLVVTTPTIISWEAAQDITADSDVVTEGTLCYAYTQDKTATVVNGVPFAPAPRSDSHNWPRNYQVPNVYVGVGNWTDTFGTYRDGTGVMVLKPGMTEAYRPLLRSGAWDNTPGAKSVRMYNLVPGHRYLVQIWANDGRGRSDITYHLVLDGHVPVRYCQNGVKSFGQYAIGRFTAKTDRVELLLSSEADSGTTVSTAFSSFQLRDITNERIRWESVKTIYDDQDVRTDGHTVFALNGSNQRDFLVNGVYFKSMQDSARELQRKVEIKCTTLVNNISANAHDGVAGGSKLNLNSSYPSSASSQYKGMLENLVYAPTASEVSFYDWTLTFKDLQPGARYLVQLWYNDSRHDETDRAGYVYSYQLIDGCRELNNQVKTEGRRGQYVVGTFTAMGMTQSFTVCGRNRGNGAGNASLSAIQLRRLAVDAGWTDAYYATGESARDVSRAGAVVYAGTGRSSDITIDGVTFSRPTVSAPTKTTGMGTFSTITWENGNVALSDLFQPNDSAFMKDHPMAAGDYRNLLSAGVWSTQETCPTSQSVMTFKGLTPGKNYQVQLWVNDAREPAGTDRTVEFGAMKMNYRNPGNPNLGAIGSAAFVADNTGTYSLTNHFGVIEGTSQTVSPQINAFQVREMTNGDMVKTWSGFGAPWSSSEGASCTAVIPEAVSEVDLAGDAHFGSIKAYGDIDIVGGGSLTVAGEIDAPSCTVHARWGSESLSRSCPGTLSILGDASAIRLISIAKGTVEFKPSVFPDGNVKLAVAEGGRLILNDRLTVNGLEALSGGAVELQGANARLEISGSADLSKLTLNVDQGRSGLNRTFLRVTDGVLAKEPVIKMPPSVHIRTKVSSDGIEYSSYINGLMVIFR